MKKTIAVILALIMCMTLFSACADNAETDKTATTTDETTSAPKEEAKTAYFIALMTGGAAWSRAEQGFNDACKELGWTGYYLAPVERNSATEMASLLDQAVIAKGDAIIGAFISADMFGPGLLQARENGAVTASVQIELSPEYTDFQIGTDFAQMGVEQAKALIKCAGDKEINAIYLMGNASEVINVTYDAFVKTLEGHDNIHLLGQRFDDGSAVTANQVIADEVKANPKLNAVVCNNSSAATIGTASYVEENKLGDSWITIGIDASADILKYVKSGVLDCTLNQDFYAMGYESVMMAHDLLINGVKPASFKNDSGCYLIMPEDVDAYAKENNLDIA